MFKILLLRGSLPDLCHGISWLVGRAIVDREVGGLVRIAICRDEARGWNERILASVIPVDHERETSCVADLNDQRVGRRWQFARHSY